jgi:hypothetical protein
VRIGKEIFILLAVSVLLLTGCTKGRKIQDLVRSQLKDPDSAKFDGATTTVGEGKALVACGIVNAKNSYGGYVGSMPYMIWDSKLYLATSHTDGYLISVCCQAVFIAASTGKAQVSPEDAVACNKIPSGSTITELL